MLVGTCEGVLVFVGVGVGVSVFVGVDVGVSVFVGVGEGVLVNVRVMVGVKVDVSIFIGVVLSFAVFITVGVDVFVGITREFVYVTVNNRTLSTVGLGAGISEINLGIAHEPVQNSKTRTPIMPANLKLGISLDKFDFSSEILGKLFFSVVKKTANGLDVSMSSSSSENSGGIPTGGGVGFLPSNVLSKFL